MRDDPQNPTRGGVMLAACRLFARTLGKGISYLVGRLGGLRVLVLQKREGEAGDHSHTLFLAEAPQREGER
jgi:membrane protein DedA with SNARE-associated domain